MSQGQSLHPDPADEDTDPYMDGEELDEGTRSNLYSLRLILGFVGSPTYARMMKLNQSMKSVRQGRGSCRASG